MAFSSKTFSMKQLAWSIGMYVLVEIAVFAVQTFYVCIRDIISIELASNFNSV
jgi:hypothetical protein